MERSLVTAGWGNRVRGALLGGVALFCGVSAVGCAADASSDPGADEDSDDGATGSAAEALHNGGHCSHTFKSHVLWGEKTVLRADAKWDAKNRRLRFDLTEPVGYATPGTKNNFEASLYDKNGGWLDTFKSPDNLWVGDSKTWTLKSTMKPRRGDWLDVKVAFDSHGFDAHCHIHLVP